MQQRLSLMLRDERGATILEFAIIGPVFLLFVFALLGVGLDAFYQQLLDDAVRVAARQIRIAGPASASGPAFVSAVCNEFGLLASSCTSNLSYSVQASTVAAGFAALSPQPLGASGQYPDAFFPNSPFAPDVPILVQAAYPFPFTLPYLGTILTGTNTNSIVATAAVQAEPYQ